MTGASNCELKKFKAVDQFSCSSKLTDLFNFGYLSFLNYLWIDSQSLGENVKKISVGTNAMEMDKFWLPILVSVGSQALRSI